MNNITEDISIRDLVYFKYVSISSTDVEQSFSRFKNIFAKNQHSFSIEN